MHTVQSKLSPLYPSEDAAFWKVHIDACNASGLSRKEYCRQNNVNYDRFGYWLPKLTQPTSSPLVPIKLKTQTVPVTPSSAVLCTVVFTNGCELTVHDVQALSCILEKWGKHANV